MCRIVPSLLVSHTPLTVEYFIAFILHGVLYSAGVLHVTEKLRLKPTGRYLSRTMECGKSEGLFICSIQVENI